MLLKSHPGEAPRPLARRGAGAVENRVWNSYALTARLSGSFANAMAAETFENALSLFIKTNDGDYAKIQGCGEQITIGSDHLFIASSTANSI